MSNLIDNLQSIYQTKLQIKEVIETESDVFSEYPQLIEEAIEGGGEHPSGYAYVTANGNWDIRSYEMVNVEVPVPPGYIVPEGSYNIVENGTFDVNAYENAVVNVPASAVTSGTKEVTENGDYDVTTYQTVTVVVEGQTEYPYKDITENGHHNIASYGFAYVAVPASAVVSGTYNATSNGVHDITNYAVVDVEVPIDWDAVETAGYVVPTGTFNVYQNGSQLDIAQYAYIDVAVPIPDFINNTDEQLVADKKYAFTAKLYDWAEYHNGGYCAYVVVDSISSQQIPAFLDMSNIQNPHGIITSIGQYVVAFYTGENVGPDSLPCFVVEEITEAKFGGYRQQQISVNPGDSTTISVVDTCQVTVNGPSSSYIIPTGTYSATSNGVHNITNYAAVDVAVPASAVVSGTYNATSNGVHDITNYAAVDVEVPIDWSEVATYGYIVPSGTYNITANGSYAVSAYANVNVSVQSGGTSYAIISWDDMFDQSKIIEHPDQAWIGPADGTEVQMTDFALTGNDVGLGFSEIDQAFISQLTSMGATDAAALFSNYIGKYLAFFKHYNSDWDTSYIFTWVITNSLISSKESVTVQGPLYNVGTGQPGLYWMPTIVALDHVYVNETAGTLPYGIININSNGSVDITSYAKAFVSVPSKVRGDILGVFSSSYIGNEHNIELYLEPGYYSETEGTDPVAYTYWTSELPLREDYDKGNQPLLVDKFIVNYMPAQQDENHEYQNPYRLHLNYIYNPFYPTGSELGDTPWTLTGVWNPNDKSGSQIAMVPDDYQPLIGDSDFAWKEAEVNMSQCEGDIVPSSVVLLVKHYTTGPDVNKWYVSVTIDGTIV